MFKRYGVEAKRPGDERWTEWTQTDVEQEAEKHKQRAICAGFKARIVDRQKEASVDSKLQAKIFP